MTSFSLGHRKENEIAQTDGINLDFEIQRQCRSEGNHVGKSRDRMFSIMDTSGSQWKEAQNCLFQPAVYNVASGHTKHYFTFEIFFIRD